MVQSPFGSLPEGFNLDLSFQAKRRLPTPNSGSLRLACAHENALLVTTQCHTVDTICASEAAAVRMLAYVLGCDDNDLRYEKFYLVRVAFDGGYP